MDLGVFNSNVKRYMNILDLKRIEMPNTFYVFFSTSQKETFRKPSGNICAFELKWFLTS